MNSKILIDQYIKIGRPKYQTNNDGYINMSNVSPPKMFTNILKYLVMTDLV